MSKFGREKQQAVPAPLKLSIVRAAAWISISWERLWPLLVPLFLILVVFFSLSWLAIWNKIPIWVHLGLLGLFAIAGVLALLPLRKLKLPNPQNISRRIEVNTGLEHRPIAAQSDAMEMGGNDELSRALWKEHQSRMRQGLDDLTGGTPKAKGGRFDPFGLRLVFPILAFIAFMISYGADGGQVRDAFRLGGDPKQLLTRLDVWVNPPAYTRKPPVYLSQKGTHQSGQSIKLPQFSQLIGRFAGEGELALRFRDGENEVVLEETVSDNNSSKERHYQFELSQSGVVSVYSRDTKIAEWSLKVIRDSVPQIKFETDPSSSVSGSLQFNYSVKDDYGIVGAVGRIKLADKANSDFDSEYPARFVPPQSARSLIKPLEFKLPLPRRLAKSGSTKVTKDHSNHPLAGSEVEMVLLAKDDAGNEGMSEAKQFVLPGRIFSNPIAKALIEQRRILALDANQQFFVSTLLDAISTRPENFNDDFAAHLALKATYRKLASAKSDDDLRDVLDLMWDVALGIEFGKMSQAERRLREAQERLSEALEKGAGDEEIDKLMKELRQAMSELMQALNEQARKNPQSSNPLLNNEQTQNLRQKDLERMMDRIEDLAKSGSKEAARQLLSEMQRMMDNLQAGRHMQQRRAEGNQMNEALDQLSDLMQKQQKLMDETFRMEQQRPRSGQEQNNQQGQQQQEGQQQQQGQENGQRPNESGQNGQMTPQEYADALQQLREQQKGLQEQLESLNQQLSELGLQPSEQFGEAGKQMGKAGEQLGQGEAGKATGNQGEALQALRRGAQSMMQQMAGDRQQGGRQQGKGTSGRNSRLGRDPLGRNQQNGGPDFGDDTKIPGEIDARRARQILEAIRKRLSIPQQQIIEKDYLERLLENR